MKSSPVDIADKQQQEAPPVPEVSALSGSMLSVQRRIVAAGGLLALVLVAATAWGSILWVEGVLVGQPPERLQAARQSILLGAAVFLAIVELSLTFLTRYITRRVTVPAALLAAAAERVAAGDLAVDVPTLEDDDEMGRLSRATGQMIAELRRLVRLLRESARETAAMASEITVGTGQLSGTAGEMARTAGELSHESGTMATAITRTATDAGALLEIAGRLSDGARDGVERNARLSALAQQNRTRLDESLSALTALAAEAESSAAAAEALATASQEIRSFVTLVRKIARQSKFLALNASMEAARAGEQGDGFAVVATEIRKLAASSAEAADRTEETVNVLLARVDGVRESSQRTAATVAHVQGTTREAAASFQQVEAAVLEAEGWTKSIEQAAEESRGLIDESTLRLDGLAEGTESFAAAMQEVAAATEEQSASAEEIASAASALAAAARQLLGVVQAFRLEEENREEAGSRRQEAVLT
jgi:methyl-accepting chemotaxis protein